MPKAKPDGPRAIRAGALDERPTGANAAGPISTAAERSLLLREIALAAGFALVGIAAPSVSAHSAFLRRWLRAGRHGEMRYLERPGSIARRGDLHLTLPEVRAVLVVADSHYQPDPDGVPADPSRGVIARYARGRDYHRVVEKKLRRVHRTLEARTGRRVRGRAYADTGPILERELGQRAGLGWFGRNTMLIHPRRGSYFFLGVLLLDMEMEPDEAFEQDHCGSCRACLDACPTGALLGRDEDGAPVMDATRCISYLTIENRGPIPEDLRSAIGNRVFGCDICQEVCPFNERFQQPAVDPAYAARGPGQVPTGVEPAKQPSAGRVGNTEPPSLHPGTDGPSLVALMTMGEPAWEEYTRGSPIRRAGYDGFRRNVAVALGNWGSDEATPALELAGRSNSPIVREHASWALERIASGTAG